MPQIDPHTILEVRGCNDSYYALRDNGDDTADVVLLVAINDINGTGVDLTLDVAGGSIPNAVVISAPPNHDGATPPVYSPTPHAIAWFPEGTTVDQDMAILIIEAGEDTDPPRWLLSDKEKDLLGIGGS